MSKKVQFRFNLRMITVSLYVLWLSVLSECNARITGFVKTQDDVYTVNQRADLEIGLSYDPPEQLEIGDIIYFEFENEFQTYFSQFGASNEADISANCQDIAGFQGTVAQKLKCTVRPQSRTIIVTLLVPSNDFQFISLKIKDFVLPGKEMKSIVYVELRSSTNAVYSSSDRSGERALAISTTAAQLLDASLQNSNQEVGGLGQLTVRVQARNQIVGGADISMEFPKRAPGAGSYVRAQGSSCRLSYNSPSNILSSATCSLITSDSAHDTVVIRGALPSVQQSQTITIVIEDVYNHPSTKGVGNIKIQTQTTDEKAVDRMSGLEYKPTELAVSPASNFKITLDAKVSQTVSLTLYLKVQNPCSVNSEITIEFPKEIDASLVEQVSRISQGVDTILRTEMHTFPGTNQRNNIITIKDPFESEQWSGRRTIYRFDFVKAPPSNAETSPFKFEISEIDGQNIYGIEKNTEGVTVAVEAADLTAYELTTSTKAVFAALDATISVRFKGLVQTNSILNVVYPEGLSLNSDGGSASCTVSLDESVPSGTYEVSQSNRTIIIRNFASGDFDFSQSPSGRTIRIRLNRVLVNPPSEQPVAGFSIYLKDSESHNVANYDADQFPADNIYSAEQIEIEQFSAISMNKVTGSPAALQMEMVILAGQVFQGFHMHITLPSDVEFASETVACRKLEVLDQDPQCSLVAVDQTKYLKVQFLGIGETIPLQGPSKIAFYIDQIRNPFSTVPSNSFKVQLMDDKEYKIAFQSRNIYLQGVTQGSPFKSVQIRPASAVNGAKTTYRFNIVLDNPVPTGSSITITAPPEIEFSPSFGSRVSCVGFGDLEEQISCIWQPRKTIIVTIDTGKTLLSRQELEFDLPLVRNPTTMDRSETFQFQAQDADGIISTDNCCHYVQNTQAATITDAVVAVGSSGSASLFNISFTALNPVPEGSTVQVKFPTDIQRVESQAVSCQQIDIFGEEGSVSCSYDDASKLLVIPMEASAPQLFTFSIKGFKSPESQTLSESFQIGTYDSKGEPIDTITSGVGTTSDCQKPCKTCFLKETTCTSCFPDATMKYLQNNECYRECGVGSYGAPSKDGEEGGLVCYDCAPECETCNGTATICTRCADPEKLLMPDGSCRDKCRDGQYADYSQNSGSSIPSAFLSVQSARCVDCPAQCTKCASPTKCQECASGYLYHNQTCVKQCPSDMIANPDNTICIPCKKPCLSCIDTADKCTKCDLSAGSEAPFLYGHQCLAQCPDRYFGELPDASVCQLVDEDVIPFTFFVSAFIVAMIIGIMKLCSVKLWTRKMHYKNTMIAVISVLSQGNWLYVLYLAIVGEYWQSSVILLFGITCSYILNLVFFFLYLKVMRHDEYYDRWRQPRKCGEGVLVALALLTTFQLYRLVFQQLSQSIKIRKEEDELKKQEDEARFEGGEAAEGDEEQQQDQEHQDQQQQQASQVPPSDSASRNRARPQLGQPRAVHPANDQAQAPRQEPVLKQYKTQDENTVKSIFNTLTIVMISCVLLPVLTQNIYSLTITHPGQKIFWEDIESCALTFCLLCLMLFDTYKKTKKVEGPKLKKPVPSQEAGRLWAGIPIDIANQQSPNAGQEIQNIFRSPSEVKRFRDVLNIMLKTQMRNQLSDRTSGLDVDPELNDSEGAIGRLRHHVRSGRLKNLENSERVGQGDNRHLEMTAMNNFDQTDTSLITDENNIGISDRPFLQKKKMPQQMDDDLFRATGTGSVLFRQTQINPGRPFTSDVKDNDDFDEANIEGTLESPNRFPRRAGRQGTLSAEGNIEDENIDDDERVGEEPYDENRRNIHGATDSVILKNLGVAQDDLRESQLRHAGSDLFRESQLQDIAQEGARTSKLQRTGQENMRESQLQPQVNMIQLQHKKSLISGRRRAENVTRNPSAIDPSHTDISALNDQSVYRAEEYVHGKMSTFKSIPHHFSLVSGAQGEESHEQTLERQNDNPFAHSHIQRINELNEQSYDVDNENSLEREGGMASQVMNTQTIRFSTQGDLIAINDSTVSLVNSNKKLMPGLIGSNEPNSGSLPGSSDKLYNLQSSLADPETPALPNVLTVHPRSPDGPVIDNSLPTSASQLSNSNLQKQIAPQRRRHTTIIEEEENVTEIDNANGALSQTVIKAGESDTMNLSSTAIPAQADMQKEMGDFKNNTATKLNSDVPLTPPKTAPDVQYTSSDIPKDSLAVNDAKVALARLSFGYNQEEGEVLRDRLLTIASVLPSEEKQDTDRQSHKQRGLQKTGELQVKTHEHHVNEKPIFAEAAAMAAKERLRAENAKKKRQKYKKEEEDCPRMKKIKERSRQLNQASSRGDSSVERNSAEENDAKKKPTGKQTKLRSGQNTGRQGPKESSNDRTAGHDNKTNGKLSNRQSREKGGQDVDKDQIKNSSNEPIGTADNLFIQNQNDDSPQPKSGLASDRNQPKASDKQEEHQEKADENSEENIDMIILQKTAKLVQQSKDGAAKGSKSAEATQHSNQRKLEEKEGQDRAKMPAQESGEREIPHLQQSPNETDRRKSDAESNQSIPIEDSDKDDKNDGKSGDFAGLSDNFVMSAHTSQLTVDEKNRPIEQIDEMQYKMNLLEINKAVEDADDCSNCSEGRKKEQKKDDCCTNDQKTVSDMQISHLTPKTTQDNFRNTVEMNLKKFKDAKDQAKEEVGQRRKTIIQNMIPGVNHQYRQTVNMYSNSSISQRKDGMGSEIMPNSHHSSRRSGADGDRPKTANINKKEQLKKGDVLKMANKNEEKNNAKWISSYNHSQINDQSKIDNQSTFNIPINTEVQAIEAYDDKSNFKTPNIIKEARDKNQPLRFNVTYRPSEADSVQQKMVSKKVSQSLESMPEVMEEGREWLKKLKNNNQEQERPVRMQFKPAMTQMMASTSSKGKSSSPIRQRNFMQGRPDVTQQPQITRTLRPVDIADPYNPELVKNLGIKNNNMTKSSVLSRSSEKQAQGLTRNNNLRTSVSQTALKIQSNFSSHLNTQHEKRQSRQGSEHRSELKLGGQTSQRSQYDSAQVRVTVPSLNGGKGNEMPFLNVKGRNAQGLQHQERIMQTHQSSPPKKRNERSRSKKDRPCSRGGESPRFRNNNNPDSRRGSKGKRANKDMDVSEEAIRQRRNQRQKSAMSGRISAMDESLPDMNQHGNKSTHDDFLDKQINMYQNRTNISSKGGIENMIAVDNLCSSNNHHSRFNADQSVKASEKYSRPASGRSRIQNAASVTSSQYFVNKNHREGNQNVLKNSASFILGSHSNHSIERRIPAPNQRDNRGDKSSLGGLSQMFQ